MDDVGPYTSQAAKPRPAAVPSEDEQVVGPCDDADTGSIRADGPGAKLARSDVPVPARQPGRVRAYWAGAGAGVVGVVSVAGGIVGVLPPGQNSQSRMRTMMTTATAYQMRLS